MSEEHEDAVLYHAMWGQAQEAFALVTVDDFTPGDRQALATIIERGYVDGFLNPAWVKDEAIRLGYPSMQFVTQITTAGFTGSVGYYAEKVREASIRRYATAAFQRGLQKLSHGGTDVYSVVDDTMSELHAMPSPATSNDDTWTLDDIMGLTLKQEEFTIPNMLRRNERLVLTGSEGGGKSVFIYQMLTGAAFGVDTFTQEKTQPQRVLFMDVENNEFQAKANLDKIVPALKEIADPAVTPEWRSMKRRVVNLLATQDKADVIRRVVHYAPDILYMGTAYKLTDVADEAHRAVRAIQSTVDRIREELDCTVIIEHHAGHGFNNDRNSMRPEGSSYWLRWPDFGYGMQGINVDKGRLMRLKAWRGDRSDDRKFPAAMRSGGMMPWVPIMNDEWQARYADKYDTAK